MTLPSSEDPTVATRERLDAAHSRYLDRPPTDSRRLAVEAILGVVGDLADPLVVAAMLRHARLGLPQQRFDATVQWVARRVRACSVLITWPGDTDHSAPPPLHRWFLEVRQPDGQWRTDSSRSTDRARVVRLLEMRRGRATHWADGTVVERRLVRQTITHDVEDV